MKKLTGKPATAHRRKSHNRVETSRRSDSYGYTTCSLRNSRGERAAACNGSGYDIRGTVIGDWVARTFPNELNALKEKEIPEHSHFEHAENPKTMNDGKTVKDGRYFSGLSFIDPNYDLGKAIITTDEELLGGRTGKR